MWEGVRSECISQNPMIPLSELAGGMAAAINLPFIHGAINENNQTLIIYLFVKYTSIYRNTF